MLGQQLSTHELQLQARVRVQLNLINVRCLPSENVKMCGNIQTLRQKSITDFKDTSDPVCRRCSKSRFTHNTSSVIKFAWLVNEAISTWSVTKTGVEMASFNGVLFYLRLYSLSYRVKSYLYTE